MQPKNKPGKVTSTSEIKQKKKKKKSKAPIKKGLPSPSALGAALGGAAAPPPMGVGAQPAQMIGNAGSNNALLAAMLPRLRPGLPQ